MRKIKCVSIKSHPSLFSEMERLRKKLKSRGIKASQVELTNLIAINIRRKRRAFGLMKDEKVNKK